MFVFPLSHDSRISIDSASDKALCETCSDHISLRPLGTNVVSSKRSQYLQWSTVVASTLGWHSLSNLKHLASRPVDYTSQAAFRAHHHIHVAQIQRYRIFIPSLPVFVPPWFALI